MVVLRQGADTTEDEMTELCRGKLGGFERPNSVDCAASLTRGGTGKVVKREMGEPYRQGQGRRVAGG